MLEVKFKDRNGNVLDESLVIDSNYILNNEFLLEYIAEDFYKCFGESLGCDFIIVDSVEDI